MKLSSVRTGILPVVVLCSLGLTGCQGITSENSASSFAATGSSKSISQSTQPHRLSDFRDRMVERRSKVLANLKERREQRLASFREAGINGTPVKATALGVARLDEDGTVSRNRKQVAAKPVRIIEIPEAPASENVSKAQVAALPSSPAAVPVKKPAQPKPTKASVQKPSQAPKGKFGKLIAKYAKIHGVPYKLARAVVHVESSFRPNVTGQAGEIGLMQIKYETAKLMGYKGSRKGLYDPATNLHWGMKYLGKARKLSDGSTCGTILKYNAGHGAKKMNPVSSRYCQRVKKFMS